MTATSPGEETTAQSQATVFFISNNVSNPKDVLKGWLLFTILVMPRNGRGRGALELWKGAEVSLITVSQQPDPGQHRLRAQPWTSGALLGSHPLPASTQIHWDWGLRRPGAAAPG